MKIGFIGAGKVGNALGKYLAIKGFELVGYYSKNFNSAKIASDFTYSNAFRNIEELSKASDILFITTNDNEIKNVVDELILKKALREGQILVHTSGAISSKIFDKTKVYGCFNYSLHPLLSFADIKKAVIDLEYTYFSLEGDIEKLYILENILSKTNNKYFILKSQNKSLYHATACIVSNYLVTLIDYGLDILEKIGIDRKESINAFYPLIEGTIKNIKEFDTKKALTGPIVRGDTKTIKNHLDSLKKYESDASLYSFLGLKTLEIAKNRIKDNEYDELLRIMEEVL